jgi:hypothetical protein
MADPTLDRYKSLIDLFTSKPAPPPLTGAKDVRTLDPVETLKAFWNGGITAPIKGSWSLGVDALKGIGGAVVNAAESVNPLSNMGVHVPGSDVDTSTMRNRGYNLTNSVLMGIPQAYVEKYGENGAQSGQGSHTKATIDMAYDMLPIEEAYRLASGKDENGNPLTAEQLTQSTLLGVLEALPVARGLSGVKNAITKGVVPIKPREIITRSQLKGAAEGLGDTSAIKGIAPEIANEIISPDEAMRAVNRIQGSETLMSKVVDKVAANPNRPDLINTLLRQIEDHVDNGSFKPEYLKKIADDYGISMDEVADHLVNDVGALATTGSAAGRVMYDLSRLNRTGVSRKLMTITKDLLDDPTKKAALDEAMSQLKPVTRFENIKNLYRDKWLNRERGLAVTQLQTVARNTRVQAGAGVLDLAEEALADTMLAAVGKTRSKLGWEVGKPISEYYAGVRGQWTNMVHNMTPSGRDALMGVLDELPFEKQRMLGGPISTDFVMRGAVDTSLGVVGKLKGVAQSPSIDGVIDVLNHPNWMAEQEFRKIFFGGRLDGNIKRLGYNGIDDILPALKSGKKLDSKLMEAIEDASDHALKNTFAATPAPNTFGGAVLKMYKDMPFLGDMVHLFPRFLVNQYRYVWERNPLNAADLIFDKGFRDNFFKAANGELAQAEAARVLARATTGTTMLMGALAARNVPGAQDLKYYQVPLGKEGRDSKILDVRGDQPFTTFLFYADMLKAWGEGRSTPANLSSNELADALAGVRNLGGVPMFAIDNILRQVDSSDPESMSNMLQKFGGQKLGIFLTPLRTTLDLGAAAGVESLSKQKDVNGDLLVGPMMNNIPGVREALPDRPDVFVGGTVKTDHPFVKQLGVTIDNLSPLEQFTQQLGIGSTELIGNYDNPIANNLVAKHMGNIFGMKREDGQTLGEYISSQLRAMQNSSGQQPSKEMLIDMLRLEILPDVREQALKAAMEENSAAFLEYAVNNQHSAFLKDAFVKQRDAQSQTKTNPNDPLNLLKHKP